jgi:CRP/FNR family transcriptional regulator, cyclic AMP receptor protein
MLDWSAARPEVRYRAGVVLIREGDVHGKLFVLLDGALEISRAGTFITVVDAPGAIFGEMSALLGSAATATGYLVDLGRQYGDHDNLGMVDSVLESLRHHQARACEPGSDRERDAPY